MTNIDDPAVPWSKAQTGRRALRPSAYSLFLQESLRSLRTTASVIPSSRFLAMAMLEPVDFHSARTFVELGSGTGVITQEILRRMSQDSRLFVLEINGNFVRHLRCTCSDRRLTILQADATDLLHHLRRHGAGDPDAVISSLGLTIMSQDHRARIVTDARTCLTAAGVMTQYQYLSPFDPLAGLHRVQVPRFRASQFLKDYFPSVSVKPVLLNFPPALVITCRK